MNPIIVLGIILALFLPLLVWVYHYRQISTQTPDDTPPASQTVSQQFKQMFDDPSVWSNYETSSVNKIYRYKDLNDIGVTM